MPYKKRRFRTRRDEMRLTWSQIELFFMGRVVGFPVEKAFSSEESAKDSWELNRETLLRMWHKGIPEDNGSWWMDSSHRTPRLGSRPWAWWVWDAPTERLQITHFGHPWESSEAATAPRVGAFWQRVAEDRAEYVVGAKPAWNDAHLKFGMPCVPYNANFESEATYLSRNGLLNDEERAMPLVKLRAIAVSPYA